MNIKNIGKELDKIRAAGQYRAVSDLRMISSSRAADRTGKEYIVIPMITSA